MAHKKLGEHERFVIELMFSKSSTASEIAKFLGYSRQSISREIKRNSDRDGVYSGLYLKNRTEDKRLI